MNKATDNGDLTVRWFTGEICRAATGTEMPYTTDSLFRLIATMRSLRDGDAMTINVSESTYYGGRS